MAIQFTCTACGQPIEVDDEMANMSVTCPYCRKAVVAPATGTLAAGAAPPEALTAGTGGEAALPYAGTAPPTKSGPLGWIALGCVVICLLCLGYATLVGQAMLQDLDLESVTPQEVEEIQAIIQERMKSKPELVFSSIAGSCVLPLVGVVCAIIALVKGYRPRWPAIVALVLLGGVVVMVCAGLLLQIINATGSAGA
jgi:hypothetical protein